MRYLSTSIFLLASAVALGQSSTNKSFVNTPASVTTFTVDSANSGCPIGFFASRQANLQMNTVSDAEKSGPAQGLHLVLNRGSHPDIQSIEVSVYASSLKARTLLLNGSSPDTISKTFTLEREKGSASLDEADVWMHQVGSLRWADLISITYADGTTWHPIANLKCRAVPSNFLLVGSK
ncbi:MAG TPA: hypothetical protein VHW70_09625 [Edaphobacter sp.]|jgi:hypothetical protein|nr:hypothetical protein [Edaphobacter sp.]